MFETILGKGMELWFWWTTGMFGLLLYWLPVLICLIGYTFRTFNNVSEVRTKVAQGRPVYDHDIPTVGWVFARIFYSFCPVVNLIVTVFDLGSRFVHEVASALRRMFNIPLVSVPKDKK